MTNVITTIIPLLTLLATVLVTLRMRSTRGLNTSGRYVVVGGGLLLTIAALWQVIKLDTAYGDWFLAEAYIWLDLAQFLLVATGAVLVAAGISLYVDFWNTREEELCEREGRLSILENLQRDARQPFHLVELLDMSLKEILAHLTESSGTVFMSNRSRRLLVLTASAGLTRDETASFERYPMDRNVISQAIDSGEPLLAGPFDMHAPDGNVSRSRFKSSLILPLVSGQNRIGAIVLLSTLPRNFGRNEIAILAPVVQWLSEKISVTRLHRELETATTEVESLKEHRADLTARLKTAVTALSGGDIIPSFCRSLIGIAESSSVHLLGLFNGSLQVYGGSEPLPDISENFRTALVEAIDRDKPLVINQEAVTSGGESFISQSSLLIPATHEGGSVSLLMIRENGPHRVSDYDLRALELFAAMSKVILTLSHARRMDITRRKGIDKILHLVRFDSIPGFEQVPDYFLRELLPMFSLATTGLTFRVGLDGLLHSSVPPDADQAAVTMYESLAADTELRRLAATTASCFWSGRNRVEMFLSSLSQFGREALLHKVDSTEGRDFIALCPLLRGEHPIGLVLFMTSSTSEAERAEYERLLTLAAGLYSTGQTVAAMSSGTQNSGHLPPDSEGINRINNCLSAVVGCAEVIAARTDIPADIDGPLLTLISQAEKAAGELRQMARNHSEKQAQPPEANSPQFTIAATVQTVLDRCRISGNLHMLGGRAKEVCTSLEGASPPVVDPELIERLIEKCLDRFAADMDDGEVVSISVYSDDGQGYIDICRHRQKFPPVESVSGFGQFEPAARTLEHRPSDTYLEAAAVLGWEFAYDRHSASPSYLSFRIPPEGRQLSDTADENDERIVRILAVDDQEIILDLVEAMCQSQGYRVKTAASAEEGIRLLADSHFDLVLTDLAMPGMDGLELSRRIKAQSPAMPIILVTGWEATIEPRQLEDAGISQVLYKPFRIEQLSEAIQAAIQSDRA
ncbi:MAG: response regulator [Candidatus Zixiibacteriota bacterium]